MSLGNIPLTESILIQGVKRKAGDLVIESQPGPDDANTTNYTTDPGLIINISDYIGGGANWSAIAAAEANQWWSVATDGNGVWCAVSQDGTNRVMRSADNGASWSAVAAAEANSWRGIATDGNGVWCAVSEDGTNRVMRSADNGASWSAVAAAEANVWVAVATDGNGVWCAVSEDGTNRVMRSADNGASWSAVAAAEANVWASVATDGNGVWCAVSQSGTNRVMRSADNGASWSAIAAAEGNQWRGVATDGNGVWCAVSANGTNRVMRSADNGASWSAVAAAEANSWRGIATDGNGVWCAVSEDGTNRVMRSADNGASWSAVAAAEANVWRGIATDGNGVWCAVSQGGTNRVMYSEVLQSALDDIDGSTITTLQIDVESLTFYPVNGLTLSADTIIQGYNFTLSGNGFDSISGLSLKMQNCTVPYLIDSDDVLYLEHCSIKPTTGKALTTTGQTTLIGNDILSNDNDAVTITNNVFTLEDNKIKATTLTKYALNLTGTAAGTADIDLEQNTIIGDIYLDNTAGTGKERARDNIFYGTFECEADFTIDSGACYSTVTGATLSNNVLRAVNPLFVDETDYKLQREVDGYNFDSPYVKASFYHSTSQGLPRDLGAWNIDDSNVTYQNTLSKYFPKPQQSGTVSGSIFEGFDVPAQSQTGISGQNKTYINPGRKKNVLIINYNKLDSEFIEFINQLTNKKNQECLVSLRPDIYRTEQVTITANGGNSINSPIVAITTNISIPTGAIITIGSIIYRVMYPVPLTGTTTTIVLDRVLVEAVTDSQSMTVDFPNTVGVYEFVPGSFVFKKVDDSLYENVQLRFEKKAIID